MSRNVSIIENKNVKKILIDIRLENYAPDRKYPSSNTS